MDNTIFSIEHNLLSVLTRVELAGVEIDKNKILEVEQELNLLSTEKIKLIQSFAVNPININSSKQLSDFLFDTLKLEPPDKKGKNGYYSVDKWQLRKLEKQHEVIKYLLEYRKVCSFLKFCSQLKNLNHVTNRLHTNLNQLGTATGRFSCSNPNLQNIPNIKLTEDEPDDLKVLGSKFREVFIAKPNHILIGADYSQIELRVTAEMSQDPFLLKAYNEGLDIHKLTASEVFDVQFSVVTDEQRSIAKSINFGLIYGKTAIGLSETLTEITGRLHTVDDCDLIMKNYFERFSNVKSFLDQLIKQADLNGYSTTLFGRKRPIVELSSNKLSEREKGKRLAMNSPIQGTAADIIKMAMISCDKKIRDQNLKSKMILQVHDELLFEVPNNEIKIMEKLIKFEMENVVRLSVPLEVEVKKGQNWALAH